MTYLPILFFQTIGILLVIAEMMIPSFGLLTVMALSSLAYSYYLLWGIEHYYVAILFVGDLILLPFVLLLAVKFMYYSPLSLRNKLKETESSENILIGKEGVAVTDLRPAGKIKIDGKLYDALSISEYIEKNKKIVVKSLDISGVKVVELDKKNN